MKTYNPEIQMPIEVGESFWTIDSYISNNHEIVCPYCLGRYTKVIHGVTYKCPNCTKGKYKSNSTSTRYYIVEHELAHVAHYLYQDGITETNYVVYDNGDYILYPLCAIYASAEEAQKVCDKKNELIQNHTNNLRYMSEEVLASYIVGEMMCCADALDKDDVKDIIEKGNLDVSLVRQYVTSKIKSMPSIDESSGLTIWDDKTFSIDLEYWLNLE